MNSSKNSNLFDEIIPNFRAQLSLINLLNRYLQTWNSMPRTPHHRKWTRPDSRTQYVISDQPVHGGSYKIHHCSKTAERTKHPWIGLCCRDDGVVETVEKIVTLNCCWVWVSEWMNINLWVEYFFVFFYILVYVVFLVWMVWFFVDVRFDWIRFRVCSCMFCLACYSQQLYLFVVS